MKLRHLSRFLLVGLGLLQLPSLLADTTGDQELAWIEGRFFDVIGTDNRSVSFASALGEQIVEQFQRYLRAGEHDSSRRILVTLHPRKLPNFKGDYRVKISSRGYVSLDFYWNEQLSFETTCLALTEAYTLHYARVNYGIGADKRICFWAFSALFSRSYLILRPAQKTNFVHLARKSSIPDIHYLLSAHLDKSTERQLLYQGYWLFEVLREAGLSNAQLASLLDQAIAGIDVTRQIQEQVIPQNEENRDALLEDWWQIQWINYQSRSHEFCDTLEISRLWIEKMIQFDVYRSAGGKLKDLMELWDYRDDEALRSVLRARCELIRLRLERVNPAYFNATVSLGGLYETVMIADNKHEFISAVLSFLNDWEDTKRLNAEVDEFLSACD